ncbi:sensor histidine kinase [Clostridioides difficile]
MLDIKSKKFKEKYIISAIVFILMLSASLGMISQYSTIQAAAKGGAKNPFEQEGFVDDIYKGSYVLYHNMKEEQEGKMIQPSKLFLSEETINYIKNASKEKSTYEGSETYYTDDSINADFNEKFDEWESFINSSSKNLKYYLVDKENNFELFNENKELKSLDTTKNDISKEESDKNQPQDTTMSDEERQEKIKNIKANYRFYLVMNFDKDGKVNIVDSYGVDQKIISQMLLSKSREDLMDTDLGGNSMSYKLSPIKNKTLVYAVPKVISQDNSYSSYNNYGMIYSSDSISGYINNVENNSYYKISALIIKIIISIVVIVAIVFPYRKSKELLGFETISRIPLEILFIAVAIIQGIVDLYPTGIISNTLNGNYVDYLINNDISGKMANILVSSMNLIYWFVIFSIIFVFIALLKHILNVGIKEYFVKNTLTGMFLKWFKKSSKVVINQVRNTNLKEKPNKTIAIILSVNLLIIVIMCSMWFFGIILALIYSVVLFKLLSDYSKKTIYEYNQLLDVTKKISDGNLEVNMEDDLGFFNPIKDELGNIQSGFKKAVDEEVKSQKMKTELISNVSHDLKTPLTSIITYIDLLKDENITDENRKMYIDTLDRKSQRLQHLIEDLFEVSKVNSGDVHLNIVNVDIISLMKQTLLELDDKISESSLKVKNNFSSEKIILPLDSQRTFRVFENLIINISKYAMPSSRVYIDILETDRQVNITLRNMSATEIDFSVDDIMERFVRGDKSRNTEGSGLGLAIAKSFVELQGGKMRIDIDGDLFKVTITFNKN